MRRNDSPCRHCPDQGCGKQGECQKYMAYWEENRRRNEKHIAESVTDEYVMQRHIRIKKGKMALDSKKYRPKGD